MPKYLVEVAVVHRVDVEANDEDWAIQIAMVEMSYQDMKIHSVDARIVKEVCDKKSSSKFRSSFTSPHETARDQNGFVIDLSAYEGQPFKVIREVALDEIDDSPQEAAEIAPIWWIEFADGVRIHAWPEEILQ
jgi:hypothetical protein